MKICQGLTISYFFNNRGIHGICEIFNYWGISTVSTKFSTTAVQSVRNAVQVVVDFCEDFDKFVH